MIAKIQDGLITYTGFDTDNNGKFVVKAKGTWTYVNFQEDEFTQVIFGYVVRQDSGKYKAYQLGSFETNFKDRNVRYFDTVEEGVEYIKSLKNDFKWR